MKTIKSAIFAALMAMVGVTVVPLMASAQYYYGHTPSLSVSNEGSNGTVRLNVSNADSYARVVLYARPSGSSSWSTVIDPIGQTDGSGYLNTVTYLGTGLSEFYVMVNGAQSSTAYLYGGGSGCGYYNCTGSITFSNSNPALNVGQNLSVTIYTPYYYSGSYYVSTNSNSNAVSASVSGNALNLYGQNNGSSSISVCQSGIVSNVCGTVYVTVSGYNSGNITFSQNNLSLNAGQNSTVSIYSNNQNTGSYYISSNSNYNVVSASISGSSLYISGLSTGSANIMVCQYNNNTCGTVYVSVNGTTGGNVWFSPSSVNMTSGQATNVYIYSSGNYGGSYYISSGNNNFVVSPSISGSQLSLTAQNQGTVSLVVCQSSNSNTCGTLNVTVNGGGWNNNLTFSQNNVTLNSGQSANISIYGNGSYYVSSNSNSSVASVSLSGNTLYVYGNSSGSSAIVVCQNSPYACGTIMVNVNGGNSGGSLYLSTTNLPTLYINQYYNYQLQAYGGSAPYNYQIISGQLPAGLYLTTGGAIYGTPQNSSYSNFTVRVNDAYGRSATANFVISGAGGGVLGSSTYANGQLIKENGTVYIIYRGQKSAFASSYVFTSFGFKFGNVLNTGYTNLPNTGYIINNAATSHPWGAWVQSGQAIYFVHEQGLIPVPSWDIFINNRGASNLVVPANIYDFQRPILSTMAENDSRLY